MVKTLCRDHLDLSTFKELYVCCYLQWGPTVSLWRATLVLALAWIVWNLRMTHQPTTECNPVLLLEELSGYRSWAIETSIPHYETFSLG